MTSDPASTIYGELGVSPGTSVTGFPPGVVVGGLIHSADSVASVAQGDAQAAYNKLGAIAPALRTDLTGKTLGSLGSPGYDSLAPGIYAFDTTTSINGILTLDFLTNPTGSFTFLIGTGLLASADSTVNVVNGGASSSIYWRVGSSATLNSGSDFAGNILAGISISMLDGAQIQGGRAIALNGAVTMIGGGVSSDCSLGGCGTTTADFGSNGFSGLASPVPEPASALLFAAGAVALRLGRFKSQKDDAICA